MRWQKKRSIGGNTRQDVRPERAPKARIFIGSSSEGLHIAENIQHGLDRDADCTNQGVLALGCRIWKH
jgi:hypothetical protein